MSNSGISTNPGLSLPRKVLRGILLLLALAAFVLAIRWVKDQGLLERALKWIQDLGPWGPVAFIAIYVATVIFFLPAAILTLGGGFVYGIDRGSLYVLVAANIAANITFLLGRYIARNWLAHKFESQPKFKAIDNAVAREGWKIVALIRLAPVFPFALMSYGFGLTRVPLWQYALANFAMIPGTLMYVYFGTVLSDLTQKVERPPWLKWAVGAVTVVVVLYVTRFAKRALTEKIPEHGRG